METQLQELIPASVGGDQHPAGTAELVKPRIRSRSRMGSDPEDHLASDLAAFVDQHPDGWNHDQWLELLSTLAARGRDTQDRDGIGLALETERLRRVLARISGLGQRRQTTLLEAYPRLWDLQQAQIAGIAKLPGINAGLATRIADAVRTNPSA